VHRLEAPAPRPGGRDDDAKFVLPASRIVKERTEGRTITPSLIEVDRRAAAPHPGPQLKSEYFDVLRVDVITFAASVEMDPDRLAAMLAGDLSIDVDASLRIARALQLSAERLMRMQLRHDFANLRRNASFERVGVLVDRNPQPFPEHFLRGQLGYSDDSFGEASLFFQEAVNRRISGDRYAGLHALWRGDRLRIYGDEQTVIWTGPILNDLDGRILLPFVRASEWQAWFAEAYRADLAFGADHAAFFERMESSDGV